MMKLIEESNQTGEKNETDERYPKLIKIEKIGSELYQIEELDNEKGYRISTVNSATGETILERKF